MAPARGRRGGKGAATVAQPAPLKSFGQHFLRDEGVLERIAAACELQPGDVVIEVGPGTGELTQRLLSRGARVVAVEIDARLCRLLRQRFAASHDFALIESDVLAAQPGVLLQRAGIQSGQPYMMAGNLPYNAGAAILRHFLEAAWPPQRLVVMLQREVARTICASQGGLSLLSIAVQVYAQPHSLFDVAPQAFEPAPRVVSTVLRLDMRPEPLVSADERERFFELVRAGFGTPRKQLRNALAGGLQLRPELALELLSAAGVDPSLRPGDLSIADWLALSRARERSRGA